MGKKIWGGFVGGIFFLAGLAMFYFLSLSTLLEWYGMKSWEEAPARILSVELKENASGDGAPTYRAEAEYVYRYRGRQYTGTRLAVLEMADNFSSYHHDMFEKLQTAKDSGQPVAVFVNPDRPEEAVMDRDMRWGAFAFLTFFALVAAGVGGGLFYGIAFYKGRPALAPDVRQTSPWLDHPKWQGGEIFSAAKFTMLMCWGFALFWYLFTLPVSYLVYQEYMEEQDKKLLIVFLFPIFGLFPLYKALKITREWLRFGAAPLSLDPFPGSLGGHVGGYIDVNVPYDSTVPYRVTLTQYDSYISGSGRNRSRREKAEWQDILEAYATHGPKGTRVYFRFDPPESGPESDAKKQEERYPLWKIFLHGEFPGVDLEREYEIPVYRTGAVKSQSLPEKEMQEMQHMNAARLRELVRKTIPFRQGGGGLEIFYPAGRSLGSSIVMTLIGVSIMAFGYAMLTAHGSVFALVVCGLVGTIFALFGLYSAGNSLRVWTDGGFLRSERRVFGKLVSEEQIRIEEIQDIHIHSNMQTQGSDGKTVMTYQVRALGPEGERLVLAEGLKGAGKANAAVYYIAEQMRL